ncbi:MAG: alcohol dehydrogenase catalytic domain-containing protein [Fidelibacterota bacterium]
MISSNPKVSIIIRTLNESKYLGALLDAIQNQTYQHVETIIVDSGSTDGTLDLASKNSQKVIEIEPEDFTFGFAINNGIQNSTGDLICILSAHTLPEHNRWLEELVNGFIQTSSTNKIALSYGKQVGNDQSNYSEIREFTKMYHNDEIIQKKPDYFCNNANSLIRKDLWKEHPFDEALTGLEDIEWSKYWMDKGYQIIYKPKANIFHFHHETGDQIRRRFWREAIAARSIGIFPVWKIFLQIPVQIGLFIVDAVNAFLDHGLSKMNEITVYRLNNLIGKLKSLTDKKFSLRDYREQYAANSYEVLEFSGTNNVRKTSYSLKPIKPNDVLIKVAYVGVCETDLEVLRGELGYYKSGWAKYPIVPGHEFSGTIQRVGSKVNNLVVGDKVVGQCILSCGICEMCLSNRKTACVERKEVGVLNHDGGYSEYVSLKSHFIHKIPDAISLVTASSIEPLAVVHKGLSRAGLNDVSETEKEKILIVGAGPIGHLSARIGYLWNHDITIYDINENRLSFLDDISIRRMMKEPDFNQFSLLIECTGNPELAKKLIHLSSVSATILLLGLPYDKEKIDLEQLVSFDKKIIGSVGSSEENFRAAITLAEKINMTHFNQSIFQFDHWENAWDMHRSKKTLKVKLLISKNESVS